MTNYYVYILTNRNKSVLYVGFTNNLQVRLQQHVTNYNAESFTARYSCHWLVFYEIQQSAEQGINREKEIKGWRREKKLALISEFNPEWGFLNDDVLG